ncbi:MAG: hypothetical protein Q9168_000999 [Polycauliona sp. 1 TL-2023]
MNPGHHHEPSSSFDSADAGSPHRGTPDTKSTALSPEEYRQGIINQGPTTASQPPAFLLGAVPPRGPKPPAITSHDPFVTSKLGRRAGYPEDPSKNKLSPIAPAFTPLALGGATDDNVVSSTLMVPTNPSRGPAYYSPCSLQSSPLMPETPYGQTIHDPYSLGVQRQPTKSGNFLTDSLISRSVVFSHIDTRTPAADIENLFNPTKYRSQKLLDLENLPITGTIHVSFSDVRDTIEAVRAIRDLGWQWLVDYLSMPKVAIASEQDDWKRLLSPKYEGQLLVKAEFSGPATYFNADTVGRLILDLLNNYGGVMAYEAISTRFPAVAYRAEFFDVEDGGHAIVHLNGFRIAGCTMSVQPYRDDGPLIVGREDTFLDDSINQLGLESMAINSTMPKPRSPLLSPYSVPSPSRNSTSTPGFLNSPSSPMFLGGLSSGILVHQLGDGSPISRNLQSFPLSGMQTPSWSNFDNTVSNPGAIGQERHTPMSPSNNVNQYPRNVVRHGGRHVPDHSSGHHNVVDINRIRKGADVRTTVRSILHSKSLLVSDKIRLCCATFQTRSTRFCEQLQVCMPVRCVGEEGTKLDSVGYAFINFEDPYYIIEVNPSVLPYQGAIPDSPCAIVPQRSLGSTLVGS